MKRLEPGSKDPRVRRYILPERVVWVSEQGVKDASALMEENEACCELRYTDDAPGVILDFGRELYGGVMLTTTAHAKHDPTPVRIRFGESVAEVMGEPNQDHAIHDQEVLLPFWGRTEFGNTGFRFVRIDLVEKGAKLPIALVQAVFLYHDLEYKGAFRCSDDRLNQIWETSAYTVHLCMQEMLWDGIKRDRLVWLGDMHPETMVINTVFGGVDIVPQSMDYVRDRTPLPQWMNGISSYSLWWVLIQHCWYQYHGDAAYLKEQRDYLLPLLEQFLTHVGDDGREELGNMRFLDWPSSEDPTAIHMGLHALLYMTFKAGAELCEVVNAPEMAAKCREALPKLEAYTPPDSPTKQANALYALAGLRDAKEVNDTVLAQNPLSGVSTFYGYYVLQARAMAGDYEGAMEVIRKYWGKMLDLGATTFWEDFNLEWTKDGAPIDEVVPEGSKSIHIDYGAYCYKGIRHSLCHGWAAGPAAWLSEHVLGFRPLEPGCKTLLIEPHLGDLTFAEGRFPTPHGVVEVSHRKNAAGKVETKYTAPKGVKVILG